MQGASLQPYRLLVSHFLVLGKLVLAFNVITEQLVQILDQTRDLLLGRAHPKDLTIFVLEREVELTRISSESMRANFLGTVIAVAS